MKGLFACALAFFGAACGGSATELPSSRRPEPLVFAQPAPSTLEPPASSSVVAVDTADAPEPPAVLATVQITDGPKSEPLACGLFNPMPGGYTTGYAADTGLDISGMNLPVYAIASGYIDYAEAGHTAWTGPGDTDLAIRIELDEPLHAGDRLVTHVWYAHLSALAFEHALGAEPRVHVDAGVWLGTSGRANGSYHLHLGLLLDGDTSQAWGTYLLEDGVRAVLCGLGARRRLPLPGHA
ncbi:MAG: hypothetical protein U0271_26330 [Polyangiaceae bacterium]